MEAIRQLFGRCVIVAIAFDGLCDPLARCDPLACAIPLRFFRGHLESNVYHPHSVTIDELKHKIEDETNAIPLNMPHQAFRSFHNRLLECERREEAYLSEVNVKK